MKNHRQPFKTMVRLASTGLIICFFAFFGTISGHAAEKSLPLVVMQTSMGTIEIELNPEKAPNTVSNFLQYVNSHFYDGTVFHRVIWRFMIQGGGYTKEMELKKTHPPIAIESNNGLKNDKGTVAMARTGDPNSATSQFFINAKDNDFLNYSRSTRQEYGYTVFGRVVQGMDVVNKIESVQTASFMGMNDVPVTPVIIEKVFVKSSESPSAAQHLPPSGKEPLAKERPQR